MSRRVDTLIIGAGAAGLFCGGRTAARGRVTLILDHSAKPAEKVRISGGGRCNFTNLETAPTAFLSQNPHFAKSALARYTPWDFCTLMAEHGLSWHEKTLGQLFCDQKSAAVIKLLLDELQNAGGQLELNTQIMAVTRTDEGFCVTTNTGEIIAESLVIATGGLSIPKIGASPFAYDIARQFGHDIIPTRPALVPLTFTGARHEAFSALSGNAIEVEASAGDGPGFVENMLFTHRGLSGPAILQISSYWQEGQTIALDLMPGQNAPDWLKTLRSDTPKTAIEAAFATRFSARIAAFLAAELRLDSGKRAGELSNKDISAAAKTLHNWALKPVSTEGWRTAEVTAGGVDTGGLSSRTMQSQIEPGLFFIGECVDVTGWLGGYNFQWAWASAAAAAEVA